MALINPTGATAAYHAATAIDRIVYAGTQIWAKPVTAPASIFSLTPPILRRRSLKRCVP